MSTELKRILYASDIGHGSRPAFRHSVSLAHQYGAEIVYIHIMDKLNYSAAQVAQKYFTAKELVEMEKGGLDSLDKTVRERIHKFFSEEMSEWADEIDISFIVKSGDIADAILETANELNVDMIVMGARKHSLMEKMILGSVSTKVLQKSSRPVLIVPLTGQD
ncbi:universal stress protein [Reinekea blandensis]|uniref:Universal stress protein family n=1 Tax=Reinekea blandensis MED297 TaxID=314283 RepID=A4BGY6_9GAMM|nr:universal stress protein [Reinekea blandensis]EAR08632.1 universal stress protein family [Reinekea sp. MED297] [Reinekea blandensis MED297]